MSTSSPTTLLPDGSAFFTTTVLSEDDVMALPLKERPLNYRLSGNIYHGVFEAIGAASMCWVGGTGDCEFDSGRAEAIAVNLCFLIANDIEDKLASRQNESPGHS